jgi:tetratricopeptide (TPR) repeat protein
MPVELADSYESIYRRAVMEMSAGRAEQAIESMLRIVNRLRRLRPETLQRKPELQNTLITAWNSAITFLRWEKQYDRAIALCESVLDRLPEPGAARRRVASLTIEKGGIDGGLARFRQEVEESPSAGAWIELALEYLALERFEDAKPCYDAALSLAKSNEEAALANVGLFQVYRETGRAEEALSAWNMAAVLSPDIGEQPREVVTWLIERGDLDRAREYLKNESDQVRHAFYTGLLHWEAGEHERARREWREVLKIDVDPQESDIETWILAALRLGEPKRAIELEQGMMEPGLVAPVVLAVTLGIAHAMVDEIAEAQSWFGRAILRLQRSWPSRDKIPAHLWTLLTSLVADKETQQSLTAYFEV